MENLIVPVQLMQDVLNYLTTQPYRDVAGLVAGVRQCSLQQALQDRDVPEEDSSDA